VGTFRAEQVGWIERRHRVGGRVHVSVRQSGTRRDVIWLLSPLSARPLKDGLRLDRLPLGLVLGVWEAPFPWAEVLDRLLTS
jgi:phytoene dehydrogenase-like protein